MTVGLPSGVKEGVGEAIRSRWRRPSLGHLAVALAAILAFVANMAFLRSRDDMTPVVVAARPIQAGETVEAEDLTTTEVRADAGIIATLLTSVEGLEGRVARRSLAAGELVGAADLLTAASLGGLASMSVPTDEAHAAGGMIRVGDRVDLIDVDGVGRADFVVRNVPVIAVSSEGSGAFVGSDQGYVVLGLEPSATLAVAEAIADGRVDIVVTTGVGNG